jgi:PAS domain S-box-containing protein
MARPALADASEQQLEALPDAIVMVGMDGRVVRVNRQAALLSGYTGDEPVGMPVEELVPEAMRSGHVAHRTGYQRDPTVRSMGTHLDIRFRGKDGAEFPADIALSPVTTEQGVLVVAAVRDITERKRVEADLLHAEERFRLVVEGIRDYAIFMLDPEGRVRAGAPARRASTATTPARSSAGTSRCSTAGTTWRRASRRATSPRPVRPVATKRRAGASARTAPASGPASSSPRSATGPASCSGSPRSRGTSRSASARTTGSGPSSRSPRRRRRMSARTSCCG